MQNKTTKGREGENFALKYLEDNGFTIIERNFYSYFGEIDIIAQKNNELYFCEVKTRWSLKFGYPQEAVNDQKIRKIKKTIYYYLNKNRINNQKLNIIVISQVMIGGQPSYQKLLHLE